MESVLSTNDQESMISSFLEIAVGQSVETARQFLQMTSWKLDDAIQLFYVGNEAGGIAPQLQAPVTDETNAVLAEDGSRVDGAHDNAGQKDGDDAVRAPLPVRREVLYDDAILFPASGIGHPSNESAPLVAFRNFDEEMKRPGVWESERGSTSTADNSRDNLASLYRPPFHLMFRGSFEKAKGAASMQDKWLLVNLQSTREFSSHMLNRDTWANEAVAQTISTNFIFWQVYDDTSEGRKVCTYYKLDSIPVVLVIDPITGQKMRSWLGMIQPESLLEDLLPFMDGGPKDHHVTLSHKRLRETKPTPPQKLKNVSKEEDGDLQAALAASLEDFKDSGAATEEGNGTTKEEETCSSNKPEFPPLLEEPKVDRSLLCRVAVRFPDGRRAQRNFLRTDPIQLLWSFCHAQLGEGDKSRSFRLAQAIPGASKSLDYDSKLTFDESGLANSMIFVTWE
ncbi:plant UBX domain-containing protein 7 [Punica granatum]|uniref:UBX domain-containing protein n=2 Tax=Punica granatum TaxID=22663 RepID=A0A218WXW9_PUNGR|nr:plant UBX domain-containing protein 7 [Punica granatum]OWM77230.1 hypothetical protein CDL15_Pgr028867 [Punica granatum]PKI47359.1 hypothetical protein CRG98_032194 [Punica granatum]